MKALILAAGLGSRLRPMTNEVPKAMVQYKGVELIKHQINTLLENNITDITVMTGYKSEVLEDFLHNSFNTKITMLHNELYDSSNSAYSSMGAFENQINSNYIHINCDILFSSSLLEELIKDERENVLCVRRDITLTKSMENIIGIKGRIVNMALRCSELAQYKGFGLAKISQKALEENIAFYNSLNEIKQRQENYYGLIRMSLGKVDYHYLESDKYNLYELNTLEDFNQCTFRFE